MIVALGETGTILHDTASLIVEGGTNGPLVGENGYRIGLEATVDRWNSSAGRRDLSLEV